MLGVAPSEKHRVGQGGWTAGRGRLRARRLRVRTRWVGVGCVVGLVGVSCLGIASVAAASESAFRRIEVADLSVSVPSEWKPQKHDWGAGAAGTYLADAAHQPGNAVTFSVAYGKEDQGTVVGSGPDLLDALNQDGRFSNVRGRAVHLPDVHAYELAFDVKLGTQKFTGLKYVLFHNGKGYVVTYEALKSQAGHLAQFRQSARSMRYVRGSAQPDIRRVTVSRARNGTLTFRIDFRAPVVLDWSKSLQVSLDTDRNEETGVQGAEYTLAFMSAGKEPPSAVLFTVRGEDESASQPRSLSFSTTPTSATFRIAATAIGHPTVFRFSVLIQDQATGAYPIYDQAPSDLRPYELSNPWSYPKSGKHTTGQAYPTETYINP
jgi:hypothetical protein